jgi:hypothetical protein
MDKLVKGTMHHLKSTANTDVVLIWAKECYQVTTKEVNTHIQKNPRTGQK